MSQRLCYFSSTSKKFPTQISLITMLSICYFQCGQSDIFRNIFYYWNSILSETLKVNSAVCKYISGDKVSQCQQRYLYYWVINCMFSFYGRYELVMRVLNKSSSYIQIWINCIQFLYSIIWHNPKHTLYYTHYFYNSMCWFFNVVSSK